jgi:YD repeat-containing protein
MREVMWRRWMAPLLALGLCGGALGCAQQVGDIDRTQPNKLRKELFEGEWYVRQTIADVPAGNAFYFTGLSTEVEKIRWDINEDMLIGYRSYEFVPGTDQGADARAVGDTRVQGCSLLEDEADGIVDLTAAERQQAKSDCEFYGEGFAREEYKGAPLVAYPIVSHFDVQRSYNAATGEQSNVITENTSDRFWYERDYMRLTWHNSLDTITLFDTSTDITYKYPVGEEYEGNERIRFEYDEQGRLVYMELTQKALVGSSPLCYYINYLELADCAPTEIEVVTSFARVPEEKTYEPVAYENDDMAKFGFFRNERNTYDRQRGLRRTGQIFLPNRHNLWESAYDGDGNLIPLKDREPGHVVYYMNYEMPEALESYNQGIEEDWDRAFRRAVAAAKGVDAEGVEQVFVICHNPVRAEDHAACGEEGKVVRVGDVRYNHIYWVDQPQIGGPAGVWAVGDRPGDGRDHLGDGVCVWGVGGHLRDELSGHREPGGDLPAAG